MKKILKIILALISLIGIIILVRCSMANHQTLNKDSVNVYFYNDQSGALEAQQINVVLEKNVPAEEKVIAVIEALAKGPQGKSQTTAPTDLHIKDSSLKERVVTIVFDEGYNSLDTKTQTTNRAALVYSLTDLEFIDSVEFFVEDKPLLTSYGTRIGKVSKRDFLIDVLNPNPPTKTQTITLYFAKEGEDKLYKEERTINTNNNIPIERYVVEELIKGPTTKGLLPTLPPNVRINEVKTQELVCQVDLSYKLSGDQIATPLQEKLMIYSLVNSLTDIATIQKVIFLMDGQKQTEFSIDTSTSGLFERNEEIIADTP